MREIIFRGKRIDNGEWVYGLLLETPIQEYREYGSNFYIVRGYAEHNDDGWHFLSYLVDEETISQYTGLTDKNGKKIFTNDIVTITALGNDHHQKGTKTIAIVEDYIGNTCLRIDGKNQTGTTLYNVITTHIIEVIGNTTDNPELLKGGD